MSRRSILSHVLGVPAIVPAWLLSPLRATAIIAVAIAAAVLSSAAIPPQPALAAPPAADLDVTFIERTPRAFRECVDYFPHQGEYEVFKQPAPVSCDPANYPDQKDMPHWPK